MSKKGRGKYEVRLQPKTVIAREARPHEPTRPQPEGRPDIRKAPPAAWAVPSKRTLEAVTSEWWNAGGQGKNCAVRQGGTGCLERKLAGIKAQKVPARGKVRKSTAGGAPRWKVGGSIEEESPVDQSARMMPGNSAKSKLKRECAPGTTGAVKTTGEPGGPGCMKVRVVGRQQGSKNHRSETWHAQRTP